MSAQQSSMTYNEHELDLHADTKIESVTLFHDRAIINRTFSIPRSKFSTTEPAKITVRAPKTFLGDIFASTLCFDVYLHANNDDHSSVSILDQFTKAYSDQTNKDDIHDEEQYLKELKQKLKTDEEAQLKTKITGLKQSALEMAMQLRRAIESRDGMNQSVVPFSPSSVTYDGHKDHDNDDCDDDKLSQDTTTNKSPFVEGLVSVNSWTHFCTYLTEFSASVEKTDQQINELRKQLKTAQKELDEANKRWRALKDKRMELVKEELNKSRHVVRFGVVLELSIDPSQVNNNSSDNKGDEILFHVHYQARNCGWKPVYDVRLLSNQKCLCIDYFALIQQKTGQDWRGLKSLYLTTVDPTQSSGPSFIQSKYLVLSNSSNEGFLTSVFRVFGSRDRHNHDAQAWAESAPQGIQSSSNPAHYLFKVKAITSVPSDDSEHKVLLENLEFRQYEQRHHCVPKITTDVYMSLKITNNSAIPIMKGTMNMFDGNHNLGAFYMSKSINIGEEFELYMGVDSGVHLEYPNPKRFNSEKGKTWLSWSKYKKCQVERRIIVRNSKAEAITVHVEDQVPKSEVKNIAIELLQPSKVEPKDKVDLTSRKKEIVFLNEKGNLEWINWVIQPKQTKQLSIQYTVEWSEDIQLDASLL